MKRIFALGKSGTLGSGEKSIMTQLGRYNFEKYLKINMATWLVFKIQITKISFLANDILP